MRISLLLATLLRFVEADAFVSPTGRNVLLKKTGSAKLPKSLDTTRRADSVPLDTLLRMNGGDGEAVSTEGTATIPDEVFNLVKSIVGAGVLSLPAGETSTTIRPQRPRHQSNTQFALMFANLRRNCRLRQRAQCTHPGYSTHHCDRWYICLHFHADCARVQNDRRNIIQ